MNESGDETDLSFPKGLAAYLRTRLQLVSLETQEALAHLQGKLGPVLVAGISAISIYFLVLAALVSLLGKLLGLLGDHPLLGWEVAALLLAGLHIVIIFAMKKALTRKPPAPLFEYTRAELERDREWIQEHNPTSKN
ncbi:phage holin family protein [Roseibacillus persicicus]|uniref:Phage holin family protein n=1 Tax=Roseibacillus persicicus TaxID=454148 RepID=A0A918WLH7_9BACT|nr:phage holin family protein [Roseibacillus persicicus]MDQ8189862.1 phage holin family protein [Roseibacillus persicicus]GHC62460.1 hypothetical protein GCM10007100_32350 [Roseibacillus persicicus]